MTPDPRNPHNVPLTDTLWSALLARYGKRGVSAAIEAHCRAAEGLPLRPDVQTRGRFKPGENSRTRRATASAEQPASDLFDPGWTCDKCGHDNAEGAEECAGEKCKAFAEWAAAQPQEGE